MCILICPNVIFPSYPLHFVRVRAIERYEWASCSISSPILQSAHWPIRVKGERGGDWLGKWDALHQFVFLKKTLLSSASPLWLPVLGRLTLTFSRPQKNIICGVSFLYRDPNAHAENSSSFTIHSNLGQFLEYSSESFSLESEVINNQTWISSSQSSCFNVQRPIVPEQSRETASIKISQLTEAPFTDYNRTNVRGINLTSHLFCEEQRPDTQHEECDMGFMMWRENVCRVCLIRLIWC